MERNIKKMPAIQPASFSRDEEFTLLLIIGVIRELSDQSDHHNNEQDQAKKNPGDCKPGHGGIPAIQPVAKQNWRTQRKGYFAAKREIFQVFLKLGIFKQLL